jgi:hypothetical protein
VICPSQDLARQTFDVVEEFTSGYPQLRSMLCIRGIDMRSQLEVVKKQGVHIVVATPSQLKDMLAKKEINLDICKYLTLDEADRLLDLGFEDHIRDGFDHFRGQTQTGAVFCNCANEASNLCQEFVGEADSGERWPSWCSEFGCSLGSGLCEARSEDGVFAGMPSEDTTTCSDLL